MTKAYISIVTKKLHKQDFNLLNAQQFSIFICYEIVYLKYVTMNFVLILWSGLAGLIVLLLIVALFVRKKYSVHRAITIKLSKQKVFEYLKQLKNQDNFSKWALMDPNMKKEYRGTDGTIGFISAWESKNKNVGQGEQEIKDIVEGKRIDLEIRFIKPFKGLAKAYLSTEMISENVTLVKWGFDSKMTYPMNLMLLVMNMDKMIGNDLETGLNNLKKLLDK